MAMDTKRSVSKLVGLARVAVQAFPLDFVADFHRVVVVAVVEEGTDGFWTGGGGG